MTVEPEVPEECTSSSRRVRKRVERAGDIDSERQRVTDRERPGENVEKRRGREPLARSVAIRAFQRDA